MAQQTTPAFGGQYARRIKVYGVSPRELDQLTSGGSYLVWTFFGIALGASLTALGALVSGSAFEAVTLLVLTALTISGGFLAVLTLVLAVREQMRLGSVLREIRRDPERLLADVGVVMQLAETDTPAAPPGAPVAPNEPVAPDEPGEAPLAPGRRRAAPPA
jgi:hypothetical protein